MTFRLRTPSACLALAWAAFAACTQDALAPEPVAPLAPVTIRASTSAAAAAVSGIAIEITGSGILTPLVVNLVDGGGGDWSGSIDVPVGSRTFTGTAFDALGNETHTGSTTHDVVAGANSLTLTLEPSEAGETGTVAIDVTLTDAQVQVSLDDGTIIVSGTATATGTVTGMSCSPTWASSNPAVASLQASSGSGGSYSATFVGNVAGTTQIVLSCGGVAAAAPLTVN